MTSKLPTRYAFSLPVPPDVNACLDVARRAEALGYESAWLADTGESTRSCSLPHWRARSPSCASGSPSLLRPRAHRRCSPRCRARSRSSCPAASCSGLAPERDDRRPLERRTVRKAAEARAGDRHASACDAAGRAHELQGRDRAQRGLPLDRAAAPTVPATPLASSRDLRLAGEIGDGVAVTSLRPPP